MTREEAAKAAAVMQAYADGKKIELRDRRRGLRDLQPDLWLSCSPDVSFNWIDYDYRIAEEPVLVPWESEADVPWNCWVKRKDGCGERCYISGFNSGSVNGALAGETFRYYGTLFSDFLWSTDGKTWSPCGKVK